MSAPSRNPNQRQLSHPPVGPERRRLVCNMIEEALKLLADDNLDQNDFEKIALYVKEARDSLSEVMPDAGEPKRRVFTHS